MRDSGYPYDLRKLVGLAKKYSIPSLFMFLLWLLLIHWSSNRKIGDLPFYSRIWKYQMLNQMSMV